MSDQDTDTGRKDGQNPAESRETGTENGGSDARPRSEKRPSWHVSCPECEHGQLETSDAVYADCDSCDAAVLRTEVGI